MLGSTLYKLQHKELEIKVCLQLLKSKAVANGPMLFRRVILLAQEAIKLAAQLEQFRSLKQLLFIKAKAHNQLNEIEERNRASISSVRLGETEKFIKDHGHLMLSLDDKLLCSTINRQITDLLTHVVQVN